MAELIIERNVVKGADGPLEGDIDIPNGVTMIGKGALKDQTGITSVALPFSVKYIQSHAFEGCTALHDIDIGQAQSIGEYSFAGCTALEEIIGTEQLQVVSDHAFEGDTALTLPEFPRSCDVGDVFGTNPPKPAEEEEEEAKPKKKTTRKRKTTA